MSQQINLFNPIFLKQKKYFSAVTMAQALGLILLGSASLGGYAKYQLYALGKEAEATAGQLAAVQTRLNKVNADYGPKEKSKALEEDIRNAEMEARSLLQVFAVLGRREFGNTDGYSEYMRAFSRQIVNGVWLTGFTIRGAGSDISLQGRTLQPDLVPAYITRLKNEPALQGKSFAALEMQSPQPPQNAKAASAAEPRTSMAYIEFNLRSSGAVKEQQQLAEQSAKTDANATSNAYLEFARAFNAIKEQSGTAGATTK
ncbi:MSHA biogenesis protein MshI [Noviherbaspirillum cavernae]|uniref:MSHA biogenesis protein MshI n=1 Tax=Noviherbaspirillum cavernae TaxID=2320862 RepID=A0A418X1T3_9BURK|nr:PilN domain-containing protein [Noviherbaspirillum cavernae]RJG06398.1 MSHA biogenesis protein MshI [Noviherbaspirillum cavernae]